MRRPRGRPRHPDILTPAEWRVVELGKQGLSNPTIALELGISVNTVRYHVSNVLAKLELRNREALREWDGQPQPAKRWFALGTGVFATAGAVAVVLVIVALVATNSRSQGARSTQLPTNQVSGPASAVLSTAPPEAIAATASAEATQSPQSKPPRSADSQRRIVTPTPDPLLPTLIRVCGVESADSSPSVFLGAVGIDPMFGYASWGENHTISAEGCVVHRPATVMAERAGWLPQLADEQIQDLFVFCKVGDPTTDGRPDAPAFEVELFYPQGQPGPDVLYRISSVATDGIVPAVCGIALSGVNRFPDNWQPLRLH